ncbi:hypothetical protein J2Z83_001964 [Virgibacillus natechei]|uniref:Uncharacterized protein n=1 Tax=Virgibacillus natechei TaxID=1216297 RepID=A0ABS4IFY8_9BACI|nr:hypothetical protein [Virgibacillus natechei]
MSKEPVIVLLDFQFNKPFANKPINIPTIISGLLPSTKGVGKRRQLFFGNQRAILKL